MALLAFIRFFTRVSPLVLFQIIFSPKVFITLTALKGLLTRVGVLVFFQTICYHKALITQIALIWLFTRVDPLMFFQTAFFCKAFLALHALIWLLTRVDAQVSCQSALARKWFVTETALIKFLARSGWQMCFQIVSLFKGICAEWVWMFFWDGGWYNCPVMGSWRFSGLWHCYADDAWETARAVTPEGAVYSQDKAHGSWPERLRHFPLSGSERSCVYKCWSAYLNSLAPTVFWPAKKIKRPHCLSCNWLSAEFPDCIVD